jgi:hypothetical protein
MPDRLPAGLEDRIQAVEAASLHDRGLTPADWISLILAAVIVPGIVLWLGWAS